MQILVSCWSFLHSFLFLITQYEPQFIYSPDQRNRTACQIFRPSMKKEKKVIRIFGIKIFLSFLSANGKRKHCSQNVYIINPSFITPQQTVVQKKKKKAIQSLLPKAQDTLPHFYETGYTFHYISLHYIIQFLLSRSNMS